MESCQNCYHFRDNHRPIIADAVSEAAYGGACRAFRKQTFALCSTTYYSTVSVACTQTRIHRTQSFHYDISLQRTSLQQCILVMYCFALRDMLQWSLARLISRRDITKIVPISRSFIVLAFANLCDVLLIYQR